MVVVFELNEGELICISMYFVLTLFIQFITVLCVLLRLLDYNNFNHFYRKVKLYELELEFI